MSEKLQIKNTLFQLSVGLIAYFLFIKNTIAKPITKNLIVGDVVADGAPFTAKYFKDAEYFGSHAIPEVFIISETFIFPAACKAFAIFNNPY